MPRIAIITDSDSSLSNDIAAQNGIHQVPIGINFGEETYDAGVDIDDAQVFARIDGAGKLPTTSAPPAGKFVETFQAAFDDGAEAAICFCVSSEVSATYNSALTARDMLPDRDITVIDTRSLSLGQGFMALAAAEAVQRGESKEEAIAKALDIGNRTEYFAALSTLKYLAMSGRVGHLAAGMAGVLNIKPILTIRDGKLDMLERIRTKKKAWGRLIELSSQAAGERTIERMAVIHVRVPDDARLLEAQLRAGMQCPDDIMVCELGPGLSVHSGAGLVGVSFVLGDSS